MFCAWSHDLSIVLLLLNLSIVSWELALWEKVTLGPQSFLRIILAVAYIGSYPKNLTTPESLLSENYFVFFIVHPHVWNIGYLVLFRFLFAAYNLSLLYSLLKIISCNPIIFRQYDYFAFLWSSSTTLQLIFLCKLKVYPRLGVFFPNLILFNWYCTISGDTV